MDATDKPWHDAKNKRRPTVYPWGPWALTEGFILTYSSKDATADT